MGATIYPPQIHFIPQRCAPRIEQVPPSSGNLKRHSFQILKKSKLYYISSNQLKFYRIKICLMGVEIPNKYTQSDDSGKKWKGSSTSSFPKRTCGFGSRFSLNLCGRFPGPASLGIKRKRGFKKCRNSPLKKSSQTANSISC